MTKEKFLKRVSVQADGCWHWIGHRMSKGYGVFRVGGRGGKDKRAHRIAYELWIGPIPDGLFVCHRCDVPRCVNPEHLFVGTNADNMRDAALKGRKKVGAGIGCCLFGEENPSAKLTVKDIIAIRTSAKTHAELAREYGVARSQIRRARIRESWKSVS